MKREKSRENRMKPENEIGLVETPRPDCSAVNDGYNLPLLQASEMMEITNYFKYLYVSVSCRKTRLRIFDILKEVIFEFLSDCVIAVLVQVQPDTPNSVGQVV